MDILFHTGDAVFSYRVAGVLAEDGRVLLQRAQGDEGYAFPGGHVAFGETNAETLAREFREETGVDIAVGPLMWVGEIFFPWRGQPCHQICLYYRVTQGEPRMPRQAFWGVDALEGAETKVRFEWIPLHELNGLPLYPPQAAAFLQEPDRGVRHFVYKEA